MTLLVGGRPSTLAVKRETGNIQYSLAGPFRGPRNLLITLAPYSISPLAVLVASLFAVVTPKRASEFCLAGAAAGVALVAPLMEIDRKQDDLRRSGSLVAIGCSIWLWAAMTTLLLGVGERRRLAGGRGSCLDPLARRSRCRVTGGAFGGEP